MDETSQSESSPHRIFGALTNFALRDFAQALAVTVSVAYLCGFIVVTAHLGRFGLRDYEAFRLQYLIAGGMVCVLAGTFTYFVGRHLARLDSDTDEYIKLFESLGGKGRGWNVWAFVFAGIELGYFVVVCTLIAASLLFPPPDKTTIYVAIAIVFGQYLIDMILTSAASKHLTPWSFVWIGVFLALTVIGFLITIEGPYRDLFFFFCISTTVLLVYQHQKEHAKNPSLVTAYFVVFGLITFAGAFGSSFYARVRPSIGGGAPLNVRLIIAEQEMHTELKRTLGVLGGTSGPVYLLAETGTELLVGQGTDSDHFAQLLRIRRDTVSGIVFSDPRTQLPLK